MKRTAYPYELVVSAAPVAVFAAYWLITLAASDPPEFWQQYVLTAVAAAVLATPWVFAVRLLWWAWLDQTAYLGAAPDGPALLLAAAVGALPAERRDWGAAMTAELAHLRAQAERWGFALGCAWVALFPPSDRRVPMLVVGVGAAAAIVTAGLAIGYALPAMRVFAVTFVALVGALATLAVARSRRGRDTGPGPVIAAIGLFGVAMCTTSTAYVLVMSATPENALRPREAVLLAGGLAGCLWLALTPPSGLTTSRLARRLGVGTALALGLGLLPASRATIHTEGGVAIYLLVAPIVLFFAVSAVAAVAGRSFRVGIQAAVWTALVGSLLVFAIWIPEALYRYGIDARQLLDGERGYPFDNNLSYGIWWSLILLPVLGLPFGVIGAAVGDASQRRRLAH